MGTTTVKGIMNKLPVQLVLLTRRADRCCLLRIRPSLSWIVNAVIDSTFSLYSEGLATGNIQCTSAC